MEYSSRFIESYVHNNGIGVLVELGISDSVAVRSEAFGRLAKDLALQIAAMAPASVEELLEHPFVKDPGITVSQQITRTADELREKIGVLRFVRWVADSGDSLQPEPPRSPALIYRLGNAR